MRSVYARVSWSTINAANALLVLTLPATVAAAARAAAQAGSYALVGVSGDNDPSHGAFYTYGVVMRLVPGLDGSVDVYENLAVMPLVYDGAPFATQRGTYSDTYTYAVGDTVFYPATATYYRLMQPTPAASKADRPVLAADGTVSVPWTPVSVPGYRAIRMRADGLPAAGQVLFREVMDRFGTFGAMLLPVNAPGAGPNPLLRSKVAAKAQAAFTLQVNGVVVGYAVFPAGKTIAGFSTVGSKSVQVNLGDIVEVFAPTTQDAPLSDVLGFLNLTVY
ncbi:hypothetical protein MKK88_27960 [Methylobacterium sp. E-005]|uniref:hypothetical protein n=1 Tax=Methylobacterium sp. E-005 TaxID=2836549 RepID=UPI001FBA547C|nr:hypothetical protein [Methylobacterium sp. E-005]MCJ2089793.1 hypothetical protein [Methylobacterium sp. E-005]